MRKSFYVLSTICLFSLIACDRSEEILVENPVIETGEISAELKIYFDRFENEANARGLQVDLEGEGITGAIEEISEEYVAGTCTYGTHIPGDVVIDLEFWNNSSESAKEMVIFHELGHCFLHRDHNESVLANGTCGSIMRSGVEDCRDNYHAQTREYYIDELFFGY